jgi:hypothetical protein
LLSLPGTILHVTPVEEDDVFGYEARIVPPSHFSHMAFTHDMWQHHKRRLYGRALQWINTTHTPQLRVQLQLPAHLVPGGGAATTMHSNGTTQGSKRAKAVSAPSPLDARSSVQVPLSAIPGSTGSFDAGAFLRSVVGPQVSGPRAPPNGAEDTCPDADTNPTG